MRVLQPGPTNSLTDVAGIRVGHSGRRGDGWLSGTTVVLAPVGGAVAGVDVRGGGPGTRETDVLDPLNLVERVHAITVSGGSAFGLAAADGVMQRLYEAGVGYPTGAPGEVVPIVPATVIFDLGRGGDFARRPGAAMGEKAYEAAVSSAGGPIPTGVVGAGTGAVAGGLKGAVGSASVVLEDGTTVAALVVVNSFGSCVDPVTGELYAARFGLRGEFAGLTPPAAGEVAAARAATEAAPRPGGPRGPGGSAGPGGPRESDGPAGEGVPAAKDSPAGEGVPAAKDSPAGEEVPASEGGPAGEGIAGEGRSASEGGWAGPGSLLATTVGVVATDATLTKAQCAKVSGVAHDGMARAIRPLHTMFDGDTVFTLATGERGAPDLWAFQGMLDAAGDCLTRAIGHAMLAAESVQTPAGRWQSYRDAFPSAFSATFAPRR